MKDTDYLDFLDDLEELGLEDELWNVERDVQETAFVAHLIRQGEDSRETETSLDEMDRLLDTAGIQSLGHYTQKRANPERSTFFGKGFLEEIAHKMLQANVDLLVVNEELSPMQARNIDKHFGIRVIDRTEVILSIFHEHAKTKEAKLQIRLAELEYQLPRLRRLWGHFDKERGSARGKGGAASRGMGEKQIEIDKRLIRTQIRSVKNAIDQIVLHKYTQRKQRDNAGKICIVGYTNAGKSTLFNALTNAGVLVQDKLFATLDSTSRQLKLSTGAPIVLSDTVGFISRLPHHLVASFKATLMEVENANLLLHVVDCNDERLDYYIGQVEEVLQQIGADQIPQLLVLNKADQLDTLRQTFLGRRFTEAVFISALKAENLTELLHKAEAIIHHTETFHLRIPYDNTALVAKLHQTAKILVEDYKDDAIWLEVIVGDQDKHIIKDYLI